jgi:hypothetical protein
MSDTNHNIPSFHTSKWTTVHLIKLSMCVLTSMYRHTCNPFTLLSLLSNIVHIEYVTHTCGHVSEVASKMNGGGNYSCSCSIKHLMMMSDTVALLLLRVKRRLYPLIYIFTQVRDDCQTTSSSFFYSLSLLLTSNACERLNILYYSLSLNEFLSFLIIRQMCKRTISPCLSFSLSPFFTMHLSCISDLLRLS